MSSTTISPYTEHPDQPTSLIFPTHGYQIFSLIVSLIGVTIVSFVFARRTYAENFFSLDGWKRLSWPRLCVILIFLVSWIFIFTSAIMISGAGLSLDHATCSTGIWLCIVFYAGSKFLIYVFLVEKVWIVWTPRFSPNAVGPHQPSRWKSPMYRWCMIALAPFLVIIVMAMFGRLAYLRGDGACVIGLKQYATITVISYDLFITGCLTMLFIYPLTRGDIISSRLRRIAARTLVASIMALITSGINLSILTIKGHQLGWVCLTSCSSDVAINAIVVFWVTGGTAACRASNLTPPGISPTPASGGQACSESKFERPIGSLGAIRTYQGPITRGWRPRSSYEEKPELIEEDEGLDEGVHWRETVMKHESSGPSTLGGYTEPQSPPPVLPHGVYYPQSPTTPMPSHRVMLPPRFPSTPSPYIDDEDLLGGESPPKKRKYLHRTRSNAETRARPRPPPPVRRSTLDDVLPGRNVWRGIGGLIARTSASIKEGTTTTQPTDISTIEFRQRQSELSSIDSTPVLRKHLSFLSSERRSQAPVCEEDESYHYEYDDEPDTPTPPLPPPGRGSD